MKPLITKFMIKTVQYGIYYKPPGIHYGNETLTVSCDLCERNNKDNPELDTFVGYDSYRDLCIECVKEIQLLLRNKRHSV